MTNDKGFSFVETVLAVGVLSVVGALGVGAAASWRERSRIEGAARMVVTQVRMARALAVREGVHVALVFRSSTSGGTAYRLHRDTNGNGVRREEAEQGTDEPIGPVVWLGEAFPGTGFSVPYALPPIEDGAAVPAGSSGIRLAGGSSVLSCGPTGTLTGGTVYVSGARGDVFAIRLLGPTGRVRLFEYRRAASAWIER